MKKSLLSLLVLLLAVMAGAQNLNVLDQLKADPRRAYGNDYPYHFTDKQLTKAPEGYKPFYISHYSRHGSRYFWSDFLYKDLDSLLTKAHANHQLTPVGEALHDKFMAAKDELMNGWSELTQVGWDQHQGIARTMYNNFPEVFSKGGNVLAISSLSGRCVLSMSAFCQELVQCNPQIEIREESSRHTLDGVVPTDRQNPLRREFPKSTPRYEQNRAKFKAAPSLAETIAKRVFTSTEGLGDANRLSYVLTNLYTTLPSINHEGMMEGIITDEEIASQWESSNLGSYSWVFGPRYDMIPILQDFLRKAEAVINGTSDRIADLRFGHDTCIGPLTVLMGINGADLDPEDPNEVKNIYQNWETCMASNIQMVFYRGASDDDILVKLLLNGEEATLPVPTSQAPYYKWSDFRDFYTARIQSVLAPEQSQELTIEFITPSIVHVVKGKPTKSLVVTAKPEEVAVTKSGNSLSSSALTVKKDAKGNLTFLDAKGKVLLREKACDIAKVSQTFTLDKDEAIYGLGTIQNGKINRRGEHKRMEQSNLEDFQSVLQSIKGWGLYWENYSPTQFDDDANGMSLTSEAGEGIDYYFMYGGSADGVIAQIRHLTGDVPMFPLWTYGFWQSKERYKTAAETESIVDKYRELQVPLDGIIQDWQYWGSNYQWNAMDFLAEDFAKGPQMIENVHKKHAHFMISIWASFGPQTKQFSELKRMGLLLPIETWPQSGISHIWPPRMDYPSGVKVYDAFSPVARDIYWKHLKKLFDYGTDAWWMDSTDPDFFNPRESDYQHKVTGGTWRSLRNAFPLETVRGVYEKQRKTSDQKRVFIMTRSAFAGQQHYGSNMWSGDVASSWDMLRKQVPAGLSFSLTGNPNFNTDIGGFFCGSYNTKGSGSAPQNPQFQELYVRWMQYGLFCPVFRSHGADAPREIWQFGKKGEPVYDAIEAMIRLRYRLIPYLYSTAWQVTSANQSYLRPLFSDFAADKKVWSMGDEFLCGPSILAAPILDPQYTEEQVIKEDAMTGWDKKEVKSGEVKSEEVNWAEAKSAVKYLPKGTLWYDFWTNKRYTGGQTVTIETALNRVPIFLRAGSILPLGPEMQYVGEKAWDNLELRLYPGADGSFTLYEDEGDNYNYERGVYSTITFEWNDRSRTLTIAPRQGEYPGMLKSRQFTVVLPNGTTKTVTYDGTRQEVSIP